MKNFTDDADPYVASVTGGGDVFVSELDESDGSIALFTPDVAIVTNISLDHKSLDELRALFGDFIAKARVAIVNADDPESAALAAPAMIRFGFKAGADMRGRDYAPLPGGCRFTAVYGGATADVHLSVPGRHNAANGLAALAAAVASGVPLSDAADALSAYRGLSRRYEIVGSARGITVIDDFAHNPDKVAATLSAVREMPGRALIFFQPHGYGPLRQMGRELAASFAAGMRTHDRLFVCDPVYFGGTVDRSIGSEKLVADIGPQAVHIPARGGCGDAIIAAAQPGDRILILGARDDTLSAFARGLIARL
jgi:UDP-N-acetylmuramate--alanine ligase